MHIYISIARDIYVRMVCVLNIAVAYTRLCMHAHRHMGMRARGAPTNAAVYIIYNAQCVYLNDICISMQCIASPHSLDARAQQQPTPSSVPPVGLIGHQRQG